MQNQKWQPSGFLKASAALHVGAAASAMVWPQTAALGIAGLVANHAVLTVAGLWPKSSLLGPNVLRLPNHAEVALTIDDGPDPEVTPQVLELLKAHSVKATFFCIASRVKNYPALARRIVDEGHHIENHSMQHRHYFSVLGLKDIKKELVAAQQVIANVTGRRPLFFRAPAGLRNPFLDPVLHQLALQLVSWTRRGFDTRESDVAIITARLVRQSNAGDILLLHDGNAARDGSGQAVILNVLPLLIPKLKSQNLAFVRLEEGLNPGQGEA